MTTRSHIAPQLRLLSQPSGDSGDGSGDERLAFAAIAAALESPDQMLPADAALLAQVVRDLARIDVARLERWLVKWTREGRLRRFYVRGQAHVALAVVATARRASEADVVRGATAKSLDPRASATETQANVAPPASPAAASLRDGPAAPTVDVAAPRPSDRDAEATFDLEVALDVEEERVVVRRFAVVVLALVGLVLVREFMLAWSETWR